MTDAQAIALLRELDAVAMTVYPFSGMGLYGSNGKLKEMVEIVKRVTSSSDNQK